VIDVEHSSGVRKPQMKGESAVGFFAYDPNDRCALLACDVCDRVLLPGGGVSAKTRRESLPDETAPHFRPRDELRMLANRAGWRTSSPEGIEPVSWTCPGCSGAAGPRPEGSSGATADD